jgi:hypothetical protein
MADQRRIVSKLRFALFLLAAGSLTPAAAAVAQEQVAAVLKAREVSFVYRSFANVLACDELRNPVSVILRALGARDDVQVRVSDCDIVVIPEETSPPWDDWNSDPTDRFRGPRGNHSQLTTIRVKLFFPTEATPEVLAEIDKDKSRRELVSRVTGNPLIALDDAIVFPAERREVTLSSSTIRLRPEHCELVEQMIPGIFGELGIKVIRRKLSCDRRGRSQFAPKVTVEVLWPVGAPVPGEKPKK